MNEGCRTRRGGLTVWLLAAVGVWLCGRMVPAETLVLKNGKSGVGTSFRRENDVIRFLMEVRGPDGKIVMGPDGKPAMAERSVAVADVDRVESEMPAVWKNAPELLATGKAAAALPQIVAAVKATEALGDLPGSWWPQLVALEAYTMVALGKDTEASALAGAMETSVNAGVARDGKAVRALVAARKGDHTGAALLISPLWKEKDSLRPATLAAVNLVRGFGFLDKKQFVPALKSFLELPVFLPDETALSAIAQLGVAQAYFGLEDYDRAITTLENLMQTQPGTPETAKAKTLLPEWQRRRSLVNEAKGR